MTEAQPDSRPLPEPLRFFGTTWVDRAAPYWLRRAALAVGALAATAAGALVLKLAYDGLTLGESGGLVPWLLVIAFAVCSSLAFTRTLARFTARPSGEDAARDASLRAVRGIGFLGVLLAYLVRDLIEAPGEKLHRTEWRSAVALYEKQRTSRTGNPARRKRRR
ncbi:hypothetical protein SRB5_67090 [Streptomyces sp. RB5]|uniref:Integral membrane protein n=1 Tax=Streptomyces smaragdinus TaxID=2585196 RepID=A0A7K0CSS9_9ACTN|nr:hypothetical protein [Streptomyces smaragdinus]MQY16510.1 hypothetical protein [Streptomyces smaragdinus]